MMNDVSLQVKQLCAESLIHNNGIGSSTERWAQSGFLEEPRWAILPNDGNISLLYRVWKVLDGRFCADVHCGNAANFRRGEGDMASVYDS